MTATFAHSTPITQTRLFVAIEMGFSKIKVASAGHARCKPRIKELHARDLAALEAEFAKAKVRFDLPADAEVQVCFEAGRDGFWLARWLEQRGYGCRVVDPGSIRVGQKRKKAKSDRIDARLLLSSLFDYEGGNEKVWSVCRVPTLEQEDRRQLHRELETLKGERTEHINRIKSILATLGLKVENITKDFPAWLAEQCLLESAAPAPADYQQRLLREHERWQLADTQIALLHREQKARIAKRDDDHGVAKLRKLLRVKGLGPKSASLLYWEYFHWRRFDNRRQVAAAAGLTPTPYQSSDTARELGISKTGNTWLRGIMVELAWAWLKWQPDSKLAKWYARRFAQGSSRLRKLGIVALARKLLVALWRWLEHDVPPEDASLVPWQTKVGLHAA